jgi:hypothetical protein
MKKIDPDISLQENFSDNPLIPEGLDKFNPKCTVCTAPIPKRRQHGNPALGGRDACSAACGRILKAKRKMDIINSTCPNCRHPSTPAEREEYKLWRKARGDVRERPGNPNNGAATKGRRVELCQALKRGMGLLQEFGEPAMTSEVREFLEDAQNLIDGNAAKKRTLRASGNAAETDETKEGDHDVIS